jgi:trimeric autotransporter adhesin
MKIPIRIPAILLLAVASLAASEHRGTVKFGGLPVPGATITATQGDKKLTAVTDQQGVYAFADLADGNWNIEVQMLCFEPIKQEVAIAPNAPSPQWELKLLPFDQIKASAPPPPAAAAPATPAAGAASVTVASAAATPSIKSEAVAPAAPAKKGKKGVAAPTAANPQGGFQRASLNAQDGAKPADQQPSGGGAEEMTPAASGDGLLINGSVNNGNNSPFAQSGAFGNNRRNGRSLYNGNIGFTFDNSNLDARTYSITGQDTTQPNYDRFTGLFSFGGPIPKIRAQNRPFFTVNYQWQRNTNAVNTPGLMPTAAQRAGDFSAQTAPIYDPTTGLPFPGNMIPATRISQQAQVLETLYPLPNFASRQYNYQVPITNSTHQDSMQLRANKTVGRMNQVSGQFGFQDTRSANPNLFNFLDTNRSLGMQTQVSWMHRFSQRTFLTLGGNFSRFTSRGVPYFANLYNVSGAAGIVGNNQEAANWGPPGLGFGSGITGLSDGNSSLTRYETGGVTVNVFWNRSPHNVQYGLDIKRQQFNLLSQQNPRGFFSFTGGATQGTANGTPIQGTGSDFAGFLLGVPDTLSLAFGNADKYFRDSIWDAYINDDWRMSPGFTLNYGVRWDYGSPITEKYGRLVNLDVASGFTAAAPVVAATPVGSITGTHYPSSLIHPDKTGFEPRIGFAWHPILASSLVVRGGYSVSYDTSVYTTIAVNMAQQSPLSKSLSMQGNGLTMATGFNAPPSNTPSTYAMDPNFRVGYSQNWQLVVQRDLPGSLVMTGTYAGVKGTHARQYSYPNTVAIGAVNPCPLCPAGFQYGMSGGNSSRESGSFALRRRLRAGLTASATYTYSKSIDDAILGGRGQGGQFIAQNWLDLEAERGLSPFDQRHLLSLQGQYSTGAGLGGGALMSGWKGAAFKEWTVTTNINAGTGMPLTPVYVGTVARTGCTNCLRPDYTGASLYDAPAGLNLNPAALAAPAAGHYGDAGRNSITGPSQFTLGASLGRTFPWGDRKNVDLRFDASNALNHVTYPSWNSVLGNAQFGLPSSANQMRIIQTTLRVRF